MKRIYWISAVLILLISALHIRRQPEGQARLIVRGDTVIELHNAWGWSPIYLGDSCLVPESEDGLRYDGAGRITTSLGQSFPTQIELVYNAPRSLPSQWPTGNWCQSLDRKIQQELEQWSAEQSPAMVSEPGWQPDVLLTNRLRQTLQDGGLTIRGLQLRVDLPAAMTGRRPVGEVTALAEPGRPLIVLGLDGADWTFLDPLMAAGELPELRKLVDEGRGGILRSEHPPLSPLLWTTMLTGTSPLEHKILDFTRYAPSSGIKEPITSSERRRPAIWNLASYGGRSSAIFGMWATYPAEPLNGVMVSDRLFTFLHSEATPPPNVVWPSRREAWARQALEAAEREVGFQQMRDFLPWLTEAEYRQHSDAVDPYAHPISGLRKLLVETRVYHRLATDYLSSESPDLALVFFQASDSVGHLFAPYAPPKQSTVSDADYDRYHDVPRRVFRYLDSLIGDYRRLAEARGAVLMLVSDHGFTWHEGRPTQLSSFAAATAAKWHRQEGIYQLWGKGIEAQPGHRGDGNLRQVTSTLLALLGLPSDPSIQGPPLADIDFAGGSQISYRDYYQPTTAETGGGDVGDEELAKLRALGYISAGEPTRASAETVARGETRTAGSYNNEALLLRNDQRLDEAVAAWEKALQLNPDLASALWNLSDTLFGMDSGPEQLRRSDDLLLRALKNHLPEGTKYVIGRAIGYQRAGRAQDSLRLMDGAVGARPEDAELRLFRGRYRIEGRDCTGALEDFRVAAELDPQNAAAFASQATAHLCLGDPSAALDALQRSLALNPAQPRLQELQRRLRDDSAR